MEVYEQGTNVFVVTGRVISRAKVTGFKSDHLGTNYMCGVEKKDGKAYHHCIMLIPVERVFKDLDDAVNCAWDVIAKQIDELKMEQVRLLSDALNEDDLFGGRV